MACAKRKDRRLWLARRWMWRGRWRFAQGLPFLQVFAALANRIHPPTAGHQTHQQAKRRGHDGESSIHCKSLYQVPTHSGAREKSKAAHVPRQRRRPSSTLIQHNWFHWPCSLIITVSNSAQGLDMYICGICRLYHCPLPSQTCVSEAKHRQTGIKSDDGDGPVDCCRDDS